MAEEAKEEQRRAFEALEDGEEQAPPPQLKKISTTQVAINYVRWVGHTRERGAVPGEMRFVLLLGSVCFGRVSFLLNFYTWYPWGISAQGRLVPREACCCYPVMS